MRGEDDKNGEQQIMNHLENEDEEEEEPHVLAAQPMKDNHKEEQAGEDAGNIEEDCGHPEFGVPGINDGAGKETQIEDDKEFPDEGSCENREPVAVIREDVMDRSKERIVRPHFFFFDIFFFFIEFRSR